MYRIAGIWVSWNASCLCVFAATIVYVPAKEMWIQYTCNRPMHVELIRMFFDGMTAQSLRVENCYAGLPLDHDLVAREKMV